MQAPATEGPALGYGVSAIAEKLRAGSFTPEQLDELFSYVEAVDDSSDHCTDADSPGQVSADDDDTVAAFKARLCAVELMA